MVETNIPILGASPTARFRLRQAHVLAATGLLFLPIAIFVPRALAVLFSISAFAALIVTAVDRRWGAARRPLPAALGLFSVWALASAAWSITPGESAKTAVSLSATLFGGFVLVRAANALDTPAKLQIERALIAGGALGYVLLFIELTAGAPVFNTVLTLMNRPFMAPEAAIFFLNPGLAVASLFAWPWLFALWRRAPLLAVPAAAGIGVLVLLGDAEAPRVGLAIGGAILLMALAWPRATVWATIAIVGIGVLLAPLLPKALPPTAELVRAVPNLSPSAYHRISIWQVAVTHLDKAPILGHGFDTSRALYGAATKEERSFYDKDGVMRWTSQYEPIPLHPHNGIIQVWLELGAVGALLGGAILLSVVLAIGHDRGSRLERAVALAAFANGLFIAAVSFGIWQSWWLCGLWLVGALVAVTMESRGPDRRRG